MTSSPGTQVTGADTHVGGVDWVAITGNLPSFAESKEKEKKKHVRVVNTMVDI